MKDADWRAVHLVGENGQPVPHIMNLVNVVIAATRGTFGKRVKDSVTRIQLHALGLYGMANTLLLLRSLTTRGLKP